MNEDSTNPLSPEQVAELEKNKNRLRILRTLIDDAERANIPLGNAKDEFEKLSKQNQALLDVYGNKR